MQCHLGSETEWMRLARTLFLGNIKGVKHFHAIVVMLMMLALPAAAWASTSGMSHCAKSVSQSVAPMPGMHAEHMHHHNPDQYQVIAHASGHAQHGTAQHGCNCGCSCTAPCSVTCFGVFGLDAAQLQSVPSPDKGSIPAFTAVAAPEVDLTLPLRPPRSS